MMSWTTRVGNAGYPGQRVGASLGSMRVPGQNSGYTREEHLNSYLRHETLQPSTIQVSSDDTYDTVFATVSGFTLILRVHFPVAVPGTSVVRPPDMQLRGVIATHPWIDRIGKVTGFGPISSERNFRDSGLLLGDAVNQVVQELQLNPPSISQFTDPQLEAMQKNNVSGSSSNGDNHYVADDAAPPSYETVLNNDPPPQVRLPRIPDSFPDLESMDRDALDEMLDNEVVFLNYCNNLPVTSELQQLVSEKYLELKQIAEENLSKQMELQELYNSTKSLQERLNTAVDEFQQLEQQQEALDEKPDPKEIIRELNRAKRTAFDESERLADQWLSDGAENCAATMDEFFQSFIEKRKVHYIRGTKMQLLSQQLKQQHP